MIAREYETILGKLHREAGEKESAAAVLTNPDVSLLLRREASELRALASRLEREEGGVIGPRLPEVTQAALY